MANKHVSKAKRRAKRRAKAIVWSLITLIILGVAGFLFKDYLLPPTAPAVEPVSGIEVQFHFIDVGQGDAALIRTAAGDVLIDAGDNATEDDLKAYLDQHGVDDLEYIIFTHPDSDHIAGGDVVLENYEVKRVIRPHHDSDTKTYEKLDTLIKEEKAEDIRAEVGSTFQVGEVKFTVLAPIGEKYSGNNNHSVVVRVDYGETSILYTGDAEVKSEDDMLNQYGSKAGGMLDCDIIKVGHHGSETSSGVAFIDAVSPEYAIISCGENNKHGHPDGVIVDRYEKEGSKILRTDKEGSIVFTSNGGEPERLAA